MSDHSKFLAEQAWGDEGHHIMSSDVTEADWHRFDDHVIFDVQRMDDVLAANEKARFEEWQNSLVDLFDDGDEL
jgi:hypothetical protein